MTGDAARRAALDCILAVTLDDAYANLVMLRILADARLGGRDAGFATELAYGALRMQGLYDEIIADASGRDPGDLQMRVRGILWIGVHQALELDTPPHAAVSETVQLAKDSGAARASGLVNAVMRRVTERTRDEWLERVAGGDTRDDLSIRLSHPRWVVTELEHSLAERDQGDQLEALLASNNEPARVTLVARPGLVDRDELAYAVGGEPTRWSPFGVSLAGGSVRGIDAVDTGRAAVQDEGSQVVAAAVTAAAARPLSDGERWLDACAGPGGKTALLGALARERGATVTALELHAHRADLVRQHVRALPHGVVTVFKADATQWNEGTFDRIVVDAPCTGLGALRRRPEARWRRSWSDLDDLVEIQAAILDNTARMLAPGGVLAYITCSPVLSETRDIVAGSGLRQLDARAAVAEVTGTKAQDWGEGPDVQLWTHLHGTDSMYLALLMRDDRD